MTLIIPERTIDTLFTFELISVAPTAIIVSPHNNRGPRTPDHEFQGVVRKFTFECKTIYASTSNPLRWVVKIPVRQLEDYVNSGGSSIVYILPAEPVQRKKPWIRNCHTDPDPSGRCRACSNPSSNSGAIYRRRWAGQSQPVASAPDATRMQPWFNHWSWCIRADDLLRFITNPINVGGMSNANPTVELPAGDAELEAITGAVRLCHFLAAVERDHIAVRDLVPPNDEELGSVGGPPAEESSVLVERMTSDWMADLALDEEDRRLLAGY